MAATNRDFLRISGLELKAMLVLAAHYLEKNKQAINDLNVFPVPDGDTGTNMSLTVSGAVSRLYNLPENASLGQVAENSSEAALMSARGNSGVILSQFLRGLSRSLAGKEQASSTEMAKAFQYGLVYAYQAVTSPVEGTILTVAKEIALGCRNKVKECNCLIELLTEALEIGKKALALTPTQLPALKEAGVVDAGGHGLLVFLAGCLAGLKGEMPDNIPLSKVVIPAQKHQLDGAVQQLEFNYCTEALLKYKLKPDLKTLRSRFEPLGDCLLLVEGKEFIKFHLHTNHPGRALEILLEHGTLHDVKVDNMTEQHRQTITHTVPIAVVAVSPGEGLDAAFISLGTSAIVTGGDTMNPSVQQLLQAIESTQAEQVLVLPNNSNIRLAAEQAASISKVAMKIVPTEDVIQGLAAMLSYDTAKSLEENYDNMLSSSQAVQSGRITFAARESNWQNRRLEEGAILGFSQGELLVVAEEVAAATLELVKHLVDRDSELLTMFYGQDTSRSEAEAIAVTVQESFPELEVELQAGGQPNDYFLLMLE